MPTALSQGFTMGLGLDDSPWPPHGTSDPKILARRSVRLISRPALRTKPDCPPGFGNASERSSCGGLIRRKARTDQRWAGSRAGQASRAVVYRCSGAVILSLPDEQ